MAEHLLKAVAAPPMLFFAPMGLAALNGLLHGTTMIMMQASSASGSNPLLYILSAAIVHMGIAVFAVREPHLATLAQAWGMGKRPTKNLIKTRRNKFVA